ncbi:MAG: sulfurtransferase [Planctomycetaceae bacterium]|nr:sulfurtransferase [Planctomycetaceae bacterium]
MPPIVNIAAYQFAALQDLPRLREELRTLGKQHALRGTILLSVEGINLFLAGSRTGIDAMLAHLRSLPELSDLPVKESFSDAQPFHRLLVKIKAEIIAFGVPGIDPRRYTSRRLSPRELKQWLDAGRPVTLLDTRNNFEVETGTFRQALPIGVEDFRHFPDAVARLPQDLKDQPVVTFCTGGIRCEKAAPYLEQTGFREVYQLDGGILKYFEDCGGDHFLGECFVFDQRVALDAALRPSQRRQCFACQAIVSVEDQASPHYVEGVSCPACYRPPAEVAQAQLAERNAAIRRATSPLPGSIPYENVRPISVPLRLDGVEVLDFLDAMKTHLSRDEWTQACRDGRLICRGEQVRPGRVVRAGERLLHTAPAECEPDVAADIRILAEDDAVVVVHKPAPLPMHPCGRFHRNTLSHILSEVFAPWQLRPVHRLDADTSGVVVFAKTRDVARRLQIQFESRAIRKTYLARVHGSPTEMVFESHAAIAAEPGPNGVRVLDESGLAAATRFRVLQRDSDGTTLLEVEPLTGRTNQIRIHLWGLGHPIQGDPVYGHHSPQASAKTLAAGDHPLCLHAAALQFLHPLTGDEVTYEAPAPEWATKRR